MIDITSPRNDCQVKFNPVDNSVFGGSYEQGNIYFNTDEALYWSRLKQLIDSGGLIFTLPDKVLVDEQG